ncbi:RHS repeat-associated core domain-containing protein [Pseudomonas syringae]|uniref:RHS repeat-associated core domain-containing protein n=1 Tax=Pseudomonas syringae TaxID=317 RepID=UPI001F244BBD|nr:RHS repeat-associated core domain-containing protein [Pseudomonas syringae]MCF4983468.1 RHS repeat-associated core domain-containing protein [Pseudomonas syringae]MCF5270010.1 RHS repeat-associated core domain-containing protein [Pseudomonas syringae]MCF5356368.1 RHS repeat-associated core domain-containing protein [Pseudomonas syringae]MCF5392479.1 RHS repeat-associated core domain-containing protein [Pseudomonas syringae]MCF5396079.1 RHS repeat-associated core domain-containing protein [P
MTSSNQAVLCRYSYDPLDRLASSSPAGQADVQRFYQKNRLATEIEGASRRTVFQHEDLLLAQQRRVEGAIETTLLATDQQRSVLRLVDKSGVEPVAYSAYGHHPAESGLTSLLGFNGERRDPVTGHYLLGNGYRAYNPVLMRFNSPDSLSPFDEGGLNAYGYCGGDPVGVVDPSGHMPFSILIQAADMIEKFGPQAATLIAQRALQGVSPAARVLGGKHTPAAVPSLVSKKASKLPSASASASTSTSSAKSVSSRRRTEQRRTLELKRKNLINGLSTRLPIDESSAKRRYERFEGRVRDAEYLIEHYTKNPERVKHSIINPSQSRELFGAKLVNAETNFNAYRKKYIEKFGEYVRDPPKDK